MMFIIPYNFKSCHINRNFPTQLYGIEWVSKFTIKKLLVLDFVACTANTKLMLGFLPLKHSISVFIKIILYVLKSQ